MRYALLLAFVACGEPPTEPERAPRIEAHGKLTPWMSVNGDTVAGQFLPTGVAFDDRPEGWRISCLDGALPTFVHEGEAVRLSCVLEHGL